MKVSDIASEFKFEVLNKADDFSTRIVSKPACCDLLSIAMGSLPANCAWVTVMSNVNTLAVATLTDAACVILAMNTEANDEFITKAHESGVNVLRTPDPVFEAALKVHELLQ